MANPPTITAFTAFLRAPPGPGIPVVYLPDAAPIIQFAFDEAVNTVNTDLGCAPSATTSPTILELATYNLGAHYVIEFAPDQSYLLSALSWTNGLASATTPTAHAIQPGDRLAITGVSPLGYSGATINGVRQMTVVAETVPDNTHFGYLLAQNPGAAVLLSNAAATEQYFVRARASFKMGSFVPGLVASTGDLSTSVGLDNPDFIKGLTLADLQLAKTDWGRAYLAIAQKYGPTIWGLT